MSWASAFFPLLNLLLSMRALCVLERNPQYWHSPSQKILHELCPWLLVTWLWSYFLLGVFFHLARKGLTGCEFLIANSQDRISCNSNQGHLRWAYACLPPWPTALKASLCCGLPSPITWLLWKCPLPPPPSLFPVNCLKGGGWVRVKPASL